MTGQARFERTPIRPDRIRRVERGFAAIPNRFLHEGFFVSLRHDELVLYFFLVLAGDYRGVSFYGQERILSSLRMTQPQYLRARESLIGRDLVAFDGRRFQVLSLPPKPLLAAPAADEPDGRAEIQRMIRASLAESQR